MNGVLNDDMVLASWVLSTVFMLLLQLMSIGVGFGSLESRDLIHFSYKQIFLEIFDLGYTKRYSLN
jgi:hypothetical protein